MSFKRKTRVSSTISNSRDRSASTGRLIPNFDGQNLSENRKKPKGSPVPYAIQQNRPNLEDFVRSKRELDFLDSDEKEVKKAGTSTENHNGKLKDEKDYSIPNANSNANSNSNANFDNHRNPERRESPGKQEAKTRFSIYSFLLGFLVGFSLMGYLFYSQPSCREEINANFAVYWQCLKEHPEMKYWAECYTNFYNQNRFVDEEMIEEMIEIDEKIEETEKTEKIDKTDKTREETKGFSKISQLFEQFSVEFHLAESEKSSFKKILSKWMNNSAKDPTVLAVLGSDEKIENFIKKLISQIGGDAQGKTLKVNKDVKRLELYEFFHQSLTVDNEPRLAAVLGIEKLPWDTPLSIYAWTDDGQPPPNRPPSPRSLILLGVGVSGGETEEYQRLFDETTFKCQAFLQKYLLKRWKAMGGSDSMIIPIANSRIDYSICLPFDHPMQ